jgi:hypothetical protein
MLTEPRAVVDISIQFRALESAKPRQHRSSFIASKAKRAVPSSNKAGNHLLDAMTSIQRRVVRMSIV